MMSEQVTGREHPAHYVQDTSRLSYGEIKQAGLGEAQSRVLKAIKYFTVLGAPATDRERARFLGLGDPNKVRPRRFELVSLGLVEEAPKRMCYVSGKLALTWRTPRTLDDLFFSVVGGFLVQSRVLPRGAGDGLRVVMAERGYEYMGEGRWRIKEK